MERRGVGRAIVLWLFSAVLLLAGGLHSAVASADGQHPFAFAFFGDNAAKPQGLGVVSVNDLPPEARETLNLIHRGGPFPYGKDGSIFGNREKRLPLRERGYYKEYTVKTPGSRDRGARRIIGGMGGELYYTDDHYNTFRRIKE